MINLNYIIITGRITQDPEIREVGQVKKRKLAKFGIAYTREYATAGGKKRDVAFVDIQTWERQATFIEQYLHKGDSCIVEGELVMEQWRTKLGELKSKITIRANKVQKIHTKSKEEYDKEESGGQDPDAENDAPPKNEHRYKPEDAVPPGNDYAGQDDPTDDEAVPF